MTDSLDLNLIPVGRTAGRDYPELLCVHTALPPRRPARGREHDRLVLYLAMSGNAPLPPGKQEEALRELAQLYYATPGSVTAGMRRLADELNAGLLARNLHLGDNRQGWGVLVQVVVRGAQLYLAHSGPASSFLISAKQVNIFDDAVQIDRALGQAKVTPISFFNAELTSGDTLLMAAQPDAAWQPGVLAGLHGQGPESLRRKLFGSNLSDVNALLMQARTGKGLLQVHRGAAPRPLRPPAQVSAPAVPLAAVAALPVAPPAAAAAAPAAAAAAPLVWTLAPDAAAEADLSANGDVSPAVVPELPAADSAPAGAEIFDPAAQPSLAQPNLAQPNLAQPELAAPDLVESALPASDDAHAATGAAVYTAPAAQAVADAEMPAPAVKEPSPALLALKAGLLRVGTAFAGTAAAAGQALRTLLRRMLPGDIFDVIPSSMMAFVALGTPLLIVILASMAYLRLGRDVQYETLIAQAQTIAARGIEQQDTTARRADLEAALGLLRQAGGMQTQPPEVRALNARVQGALDQLDMIDRVNYQPAIINGLPVGVRITRIVQADEALYLLDSISGSVLRAVFTERGYDLDPTFQCGPMPGSSVPVGPLIDITAWPQGYKPAAELVGLDAAGRAIYCASDQTARSEKLKEPPADAWGNLAGFALELGDTYVLDLASKGLWIYWRSDFQPEPNMFFNDEIPLLDDVVDLAVNRSDLYLLHQDGTLTLCGYSDFQGVPTRCAAPRYVDFRPGRENMPLIPPAPFIQVQNTQPPDPSLFLLEGQTQAIYHFSLRNLSFQRQYTPLETLPGGAASAFLVDNIKRYVYLAVGAQVYYGIMP